MSKQDRYDQMYINIAHDISDMSHDSEIKVGSIIVKDDNIISMGWNGMPSGMDNNTRSHTGCTNKEVIHSEMNALMKLAKTGGSCNGATLYTTHSPCWECAKLLLQAGISRVVFTYQYDETATIFLLERDICRAPDIQPNNRILEDKGRQSKSQ